MFIVGLPPYLRYFIALLCSFARKKGNSLHTAIVTPESVQIIGLKLGFKCCFCIERLINAHPEETWETLLEYHYLMEKLRH